MSTSRLIAVSRSKAPLTAGFGQTVLSAVLSPVSTY